ncbi:MAG: OmcA/MtrC family decaheme c-type cytochrome [Acidobacteriota bacterium]
MRINSSAAIAVRSLAVLAFVAGSAVLVSNSDTPVFTVHDKAYYADPNLVNFVRPGLVLKVLSATVPADRTIRVRFTIADPKGLPLDLDGITTPGPVAMRFVLAYIPADENQYVSYATRATTSPITNVTAVQPFYDSNGKFEKVSDGTYDYISGTKLPGDYDRNATHSVGIRAQRNLSEFGLPENIANDVFHFVPAGGEVKKVRDVVRTESCNRCHDPLTMHGASRRVDLCILCHNPRNVDPDTGNSVNFPVLIHKIHMGANLPSVKAGKPFRIIGSRPDAIFDFSDVEFPADVRNCEVCHDPKSGAKQADAWLKPNRTACGACHDNVSFATGDGHRDLPQVSDNQCATCHVPQGELEYDASIRGAHMIERFSKSLPGTTLEILKVADGAAGKRPTVTFSIRDKAGNPIPPSKMDYLYLILTGPTAEYTGSAVSEDVRKAEGTPDGVYYWTFENPIPADAKGSYGMGIAGYRNIKLLEGTKKELTARDIGINKVSYFSVDGSKVQPRRQVVAIEKCNECHYSLGMHGNGRNRTEHCVQCHNPSLTDATGSAAAGVQPGPLLFRYMIHRIHTGRESREPFIVYARTRQYNFGELRFPGDRRNCAKCHVNGSEQLPLPEDLPNVNNPRGPLNPMGPAAAACLGCHTETAAAAHALSMTTTIGEACAACHGRNAEFSVNRVHAR